MSTSSLIYILAELNGLQIKVPYSEFEALFVKYNQTTPSSPNSLPTNSTLGMVTADGWDPGFLDDGGLLSSFYVYSNNLWRKIPTYTNHWSDLEGDKVRFLPLHKKLTDEDALTEEEVENLRHNLSLPIATVELPGLVKAGEASAIRSYVQVVASEDESSEENGKMFVQFATLTNPGTVLVEDIIPPETSTESDANGEQGDVQEGEQVEAQSEEQAGETDGEVNGESSGEESGEESGGEQGETQGGAFTDFPIVVYSKAAVDAKLKGIASGVPTASADTLGLIAVGDHLAMGDDGRLTVIKAPVQNDPEYGVVKYANANYKTDITADVNHIYVSEQEENATTLTIQQIKALVDSKIKNYNFANIELPAASATQAGVISVDGEIFTIDYTKDAKLDINLASKTTKGAVFVINAINDPGENENDTTEYSKYVPTALSVINFVNNKITGIESQLVTIPMASATTLGGIKVGSGLYISDTGVLQVNYPITSATTLGLVKTLDTATFSNGINNDPTLVPTVGTMQSYVNSKLSGYGSIPVATYNSLGGVYVWKDPNEASSDPNPTVCTKNYVDTKIASCATKKYVDLQISSILNGLTIIPKATEDNAGAVRVKVSSSSELNNTDNGGYVVPTINYMEDRIATIKGSGSSGGSSTSGKDVGDVCSAYSKYKNWLLIGSDTLYEDRLILAASKCITAYPQYEGINEFELLNKTKNETFPEGHNVLTFSTSLPYTFVLVLIQYYYNNTGGDGLDASKNPLNVSNIGFVILPATTIYSQTLALETPEE